jgi:hypothetical protein
MIPSRIVQVNRSKLLDQEKIETFLFRVYSYRDAVFKIRLPLFGEGDNRARRRGGGTRMETAVERAGKVEYK